MKITFNTYVTGTPCETAPGPTETCYEDDDFVAAVNYAMFADFDVMSMSYSGDFGASVYPDPPTCPRNRDLYSNVPWQEPSTHVGRLAADPALNVGYLSTRYGVDLATHLGSGPEFGCMAIQEIPDGRKSWRRAPPWWGSTRA